MPAVEIDHVRFGVAQLGCPATTSHWTAELRPGLPDAGEGNADGEGPQERCEWSGEPSSGLDLGKRRRRASNIGVNLGTVSESLDEGMMRFF